MHFANGDAALQSYIYIACVCAVDYGENATMSK